MQFIIVIQLTKAVIANYIFDFYQGFDKQSNL